MKNLSAIGMDISKQVFELYGYQGKNLMKCRLYRSEVLEHFAGKAPMSVFMEAGGGAHYWGRKLQELGHKVKLIAPQFVKPFVLSNKNDRVDARAIYVASQAPEMRFVEVKSIDSQELQHLHRIRSRVIKSRTATNNELRGIMLEYGIVIPKGRAALKLVSERLETCTDITSFGKKLIERVLNDVRTLDKQIAELDTEIENLSKSHPVCARLRTIPGVGPIIATAIVAAVSNPDSYKNGRQFSASLGLVPKHSGTGGKNTNAGISKRGDTYIRSQLIHGARSLLYRAHLKQDPLSRWAANLKQTRGWNRASVALANKNARIIWALLRYEKDFSPTLRAA